MTWHVNGAPSSVSWCASQMSGRPLSTGSNMVGRRRRSLAGGVWTDTRSRSATKRSTSSHIPPTDTQSGCGVTCRSVRLVVAFPATSQSGTWRCADLIGLLVQFKQFIRICSLTQVKGQECFSRLITSAIPSTLSRQGPCAFPLRSSSILSAPGASP